MGAVRLIPFPPPLSHKMFWRKLLGNRTGRTVFCSRKSCFRTHAFVRTYRCPFLPSLRLTPLDLAFFHCFVEPQGPVRSRFRTHGENDDVRDLRTRPEELPGASWTHRGKVRVPLQSTSLPRCSFFSAVVHQPECTGVGRSKLARERNVAYALLLAVNFLNKIRSQFVED